MINLASVCVHVKQMTFNLSALQVLEGVFQKLTLDRDRRAVSSTAMSQKWQQQ